MGDGRLEALVLVEAGRRALENWRSGETARLALRARIDLACADGGPSTGIAADAGGQQPARSADEVRAATSGQVRRCVCTKLDVRLLTGAMPRAVLDHGASGCIFVVWI
jgi:hypothetical protein